MINFAINSFEDKDFETRTTVKCLVREGKTLVSKFVAAIKKDRNLEAEISDLYAIIEYVANGTYPKLPDTKYRILTGIKSKDYQAFEAKSKNLRLYLFFDRDMIIIFGGKKVEQDEDKLRVKQILKDYNNSK